MLLDCERCLIIFSLDTSAALTAWHSLSNARLTVIADSHPVSNSLPNSLQFSVPTGSSGAVGFTNEGFWGTRPSFHVPHCHQD